MPNGGSGKKYHFGVSGNDLKHFIPDVYWGTILGPSYVHHFGEERITSSPAHAVTKLADTMYYLQMTEDLVDCMERPEVVDEVRMRVKEHLNRDSFFDPWKGREYSYSVPDFALPITDWDGEGPAEG